jgi:hypothetical protein
MTEDAFNRLPHPSGYADAMLGWFTRLGIDGDATTLPDLCVAAG